MADALQKAMKKQRVTATEMARRMGTSRPTVYRLVDPNERGATLDPLERASLKPEAEAGAQQRRVMTVLEGGRIAS